MDFVTYQVQLEAHTEVVELNMNFTLIHTQQLQLRVMEL